MKIIEGKTKSNIKDVCVGESKSSPPPRPPIKATLNNEIKYLKETIGKQINQILDLEYENKQLRFINDKLYEQISGLKLLYEQCQEIKLN